MFQHVPNVLTGARLVLACVFFVMLSAYQYQGRGDPTLMISALVVYSVALATDFLDGHLARKWKVEGAFGRIVDPFADKILVLGSFIFFAGKNFIIPDSEAIADHPHYVVKTITGVAPGIVVILLARELLVTTLRGLSESGGQSFGAVWAGKFKMAFQSCTILVILAYVTFRPWLLEAGYEVRARIVRDIGIWATVLITLYSAIAYVRKAVTLYRGERSPA